MSDAKARLPEKAGRPSKDKLGSGKTGVRGPAPADARQDRGRTNEAVKPWVALGMSRRTWYRRKAKGKS